MIEHLQLAYELSVSTWYVGLIIVPQGNIAACHYYIVNNFGINACPVNEKVDSPSEAMGLGLRLQQPEERMVWSADACVDADAGVDAGACVDGALVAGMEVGPWPLSCCYDPGQLGTVSSALFSGSPDL